MRTTQNGTATEARVPRRFGGAGLNDEHFLLLLVVLELAALAALRHGFRRHHGG